MYVVLIVHFNLVCGIFKKPGQVVKRMLVFKVFYLYKHKLKQWLFKHNILLVNVSGVAVKHRNLFFMHRPTAPGGGGCVGPTGLMMVSSRG